MLRTPAPTTRRPAAGTSTRPPPALAAAAAAARRRHAAAGPRAEPGSSSGNGAPAGLSEDVLARLRAAEQEAARLREELAQVQQQQGGAAAAAAAASPSAAASAAAGTAAAADASAAAGPAGRIDSTDSRELPWTAGKRTAWLSEADVTFFTGAGLTEGAGLGEAGGASASAASPEAEGVVRRRLLQGALATAALAAFAVVPTRALRLGAPAKPLFFYLVPLVKALDQLRDLETAVEDADWPRLRAARAAIVGPPGNARQNLYDAVAALDTYSGDSAVAKGAAKRAEALAGEVVEALDALDYNRYFDSAMMGAAPSGAQNAEFVKFTREARRAAERGLRAFLALMPSEAVEGARQVVEQQREAMAAM